MRAEVRLDDEGNVDEVLLYDDDLCVMHMERLDRHAIWFALYPDGQKTAEFDIWRDGKHVRLVQR